MGPYGSYMGTLWELNGHLMDAIWAPYGCYVGTLWVLYGHLMGTKWAPYLYI
jgi:hypothetical protein